MDNIQQALHNLSQTLGSQDRHQAVSFAEFLRQLAAHPDRVLRSVIQVFHDMILAHVGEGVDEYPGDPESIRFVRYDSSALFVTGADHPFFADRIFANRLFKHIEALRHGAQQNRVYIFEGPPGCGKSTFLNNLLWKFEAYANTAEGGRFEAVWRLSRRTLAPGGELGALFRSGRRPAGGPVGEDAELGGMWRAVDDWIEIPCPSHDNPILLVPKALRRNFLDDVLPNDAFKWKLFNEKEYEWVFRESPCTICASLFEALLERLESPQKVFETLYARRYHFNRRVGEGITVYNPGDRPLERNVLTNPMLQGRLDDLLQDSNRVRYLFSQYARTNNGIYALMDIKSHNTDRLLELHNIISEGVHKVEDIEESVHSLFLALMNPEDKSNIEGIQSFSDRIVYIKIPYVLDFQTEVEIYRNIFGRLIGDRFLPRVLDNFARVIVSTRLQAKSEALLEWVGDPKKYALYCDENLHLLKMEIYTGHIPTWLSEEDRKGFTAARRRRIIAESEAEGERGLSGRDAIKIFNDFYASQARDDRLINMAMLYRFFTTVRKDLAGQVPGGFLDSLLRMYDYAVLQEVKESLYYYNEAQIARDIQNYLFAVNFESGSVQTCKFTGDRLELTPEFFAAIEKRLLGPAAGERARLQFRAETQREYAARTLTQEMRLEGKPLPETELFRALYERYTRNLKERALDPFLENDNFRNAIKDAGSDAFRTYDQRIRDDVTFLLDNLAAKFQYSPLGAKEVCIYVIDNDLAKKFGQK